MNILVCTDGSSGSIHSAELISKVGFPKDTKITVLGVSENKDDLVRLTASMDLIYQMLIKQFGMNRKIRNGDPIEEILSEAVESSCDLVAVGSGRQQLGLLNPQLGSTTSRLARKLHTHFLVARNVPEKITKILVCAGAEATSDRTMMLGGRWISNLEAQIGLLHVVPAKSIQGVKEATAEISTTRQGDDNKSSKDDVLSLATQQLRNAGVKGEIRAQIRQGLVVEQVIDELSKGAYELLVVGAHYQPGQDRWQGTLLDDVTDQLLNRSSCSVLII